MFQIIFFHRKHFIFTCKFVPGMNAIAVTNNTAQQEFEVHQDGRSNVCLQVL